MDLTRQVVTEVDRPLCADGQCSIEGAHHGVTQDVDLRQQWQRQQQWQRWQEWKQ